MLGNRYQRNGHLVPRRRENADSQEQKSKFAQFWGRKEKGEDRLCKSEGNIEGSNNKREGGEMKKCPVTERGNLQKS